MTDSSEPFAELRRMCRETPIVERPREPASPWGQYRYGKEMGELMRLTAAGKEPVVPVPAGSDPYAEFRQAMRTMLAFAVSTKAQRDRLAQMAEWLEANPFHDQHAARSEQHHLEKMDFFVLEGKLVDLSVRVEYWEHRLSEEQRAKVEDWLGERLSNGFAYRWAKVAQWVGSDDLPELVKIGEVTEAPY